MTIVSQRAPSSVRKGGSRSPEIQLRAQNRRAGLRAYSGQGTIAGNVIQPRVRIAVHTDIEGPMITITDEYAKSLPPIYKDILTSFFMFNPQQRLGERVAMQSLYSAIRDKKYTLAQVRAACEKMAQADVVRISDQIFVEPTDLGRALIEHLERPAPELVSVPDFPPLKP
jgi:hypothetical protein